MMVWYGHGWGWGGWLLMTFSMIVFWGLVIGALVALLRTGRGTGPGTPPEHHQERSAEQILAERYASGDIDEQEYHRRLEVLRSPHGPSGLTKVG